MNWVQWLTFGLDAVALIGAGFAVYFAVQAWRSGRAIRRRRMGR